VAGGFALFSNIESFAPSVLHQLAIQLLTRTDCRVCLFIPSLLLGGHVHCLLVVQNSTGPHASVTPLLTQIAKHSYADKHYCFIIYILLGKYIGSSSRQDKDGDPIASMRFGEHDERLSNNRHHCSALQSVFNGMQRQLDFKRDFIYKIYPRLPGESGALMLLRKVSYEQAMLDSTPDKYNTLAKASVLDPAICAMVCVCVCRVCVCVTRDLALAVP
jgi:hypothetical protein